MVRWLKLPTTYVVKDQEKEREMWILVNEDIISQVEPYFVTEDLLINKERIVLILATGDKIACDLSLEEYLQFTQHEIIDATNGVDQDSVRDTDDYFEPI